MKNEEQCVLCQCAQQTEGQDSLEMEESIPRNDSWSEHL